MITPRTRDRLARFVGVAINDVGLDVAGVLTAWDKVATSPNLRLDGNQAEMRAEVVRLAWQTAAQGCPERLATNGDDTADADDDPAAARDWAASRQENHR